MSVSTEVTEPTVRCYSCGGLGKQAPNGWVHANAVAREHLFDPRPRDMKAWRTWKREALA